MRKRIIILLTAIKSYGIKLWQLNKKLFLGISMSIIFFLGGYILYYYLASDVLYYQNKDFPNVIIQERRIIKKVAYETHLQALIRSYLDGSAEYSGKIPFSYDAKIISVSHDKEKKYLIINWNSYLMKDMYNDTISQDIELLIKTINKNFDIEKIYFLIEEKEFSIPWKDGNLGFGVLIKEV